jgi:hypothetical protein
LLGGGRPGAVAPSLDFHSYSTSWCAPRGGRALTTGAPATRTPSGIQRTELAQIRLADELHRQPALRQDNGRLAVTISVVTANLHTWRGSMRCCATACRPG